VLLGREAFQQVAENRLKKVRRRRAAAAACCAFQRARLSLCTALTQGDVLVVAQLAGVGGAKLTSQLIPLCHSLNLRRVCGASGRSLAPF